MGRISYTVPVAGTDQNSIADAEVSTALQTLLTLVNGNLDLSNLTTTVGNLIPTAWQAWTPTFTASLTAMSLGTSALVARYQLVGKTCSLRVALSPDSSFNGGTGIISMSLPFAAQGQGAAEIIAKLYASQDGFNSNKLGLAEVGANATSATILFAQSTGNCSLGPFVNAQGTGGYAQCPAVTSGFPLQSGNSLVISGSYEIA